MSVKYAQLHHVNMFTTRLDEMTRWYERVLGMRAVHAAPFAVWMTNDRANHRVALTAVPRLELDPEQRVHARVHHVAFEYESFADLDASYVRLRGEGIVPRACLDHGMTFSYYYADPDGNYVELQCDVFGDWDASRTWMEASPDFAANPIGAFVDPDKVAAAAAEGVPFEEIRRRVWETDDFRPDALPDMGGPLPHPDDPPLPVKW
jgi:catechol 2,3-dioxygenase-like lactoylglutathione lyase family enzyme